ncbi:MAG TPA: AsmA-like C-terminal region-containing protein [Cytophagaceae bacterium]
MKKGLLIFLGIIVFLLAVLFAAPFLFKDEIKAKIDAELANTINGEVLYNPDGFSLTFFRNFPNITISLEDIGLISHAEAFKGDTLFKTDKLSLVADVMSVISGDQIKIKGISLVKPYIYTKMTADGKNSWDIMKASPEDTVAVTEEEESSEFNIGFEKWEIIDGTIIYVDESLPMYAQLNHLNHEGKGDLTQEIVDIATYTESPDVFIVYDNITYLKKHSFKADVKMNMNYVKGEYRFMENEFAINNFVMGLDGFIGMPGDDIVMDLTYKAKETDFKNLLSLIPAVYAKDFDKLEAAGKIAFDGTIKGTFNEQSMPGFSLNLQINDGMMHYPSLPTSVKDVVMDLAVMNTDGIIDNTIIDLKKFHMSLGENPVDAKVLVEGLNPYKIDANVLAKLNLGDLTKMFPIEGTDLKGIFSMDVTAKGVYSDSLNLMPVVNAKMGLKDGYVKNSEVPFPLEKVNFNAGIISDGQMPTTKVSVDNFDMLLDNEPFSMKAYVVNLDDPNFDVSLKGILDLDKLTKVYPLEDMTVGGRISADITTKGVMSDIDAGRYGNTSTSGTMSVKNLKYTSPDMPQGLTLSTADFAFTPDKLNINTLEGTLGRSDINVNGYVSNYMGYMFGSADTTLRGKMNFASRKFDVNEWMTDDEAATTEPVEEEPLEVFEVPKNIDFVLASAINEVLYDNMVLKDLKGNIIVKDGIVRMDKVGFNTLGGSIVTNGSYNTQDINNPLFDFDMDMKNIAIKEAYATFNTVKSFAPVAEKIDGNFSTILKLKGKLGKDMMPDYATLSGAGMAEVLSAKMEGSKVMGGISKLTKVNELDPMQLKDIKIQYEIKDGKLFVKPFDVKAGNVKMNIEGSNGLDGAIDYFVKMDLPAGAIGSTVNNALSGGNSKNQNIKMDIKILGTYDDPKLTLANSTKEQATEAAKEMVKDKVKEEIDNNAEIQKAKADVEKAKQEAEEKLKAEQERIKQELEQKKKEEEERLKKEAEKQIKDKIKLPKF